MGYDLLCATDPTSAPTPSTDAPTGPPVVPTTAAPVVPTRAPTPIPTPVPSDAPTEADVCELINEKNKKVNIRRGRCEKESSRCEMVGKICTKIDENRTPAPVSTPAPVGAKEPSKCEQIDS